MSGGAGGPVNWKPKRKGTVPEDVWQNIDRAMEEARRDFEMAKHLPIDAFLRILWTKVDDLQRQINELKG